MSTASERELFTVGHSTLVLDALAGLLATHGIDCLVDVRTVPRSRRHPQFNGDALASSLRARGVRYEHVRELGGFRTPRPGTRNDGWENPSFRGYADHMGTEEFGRGLACLEQLAAKHRTTVMCSEAVWWRCHRRLVADALLVRGWTVLHVAPNGRASRHELTPFAEVGPGGSLAYPGPQLRLDDLGG